MAEIETLTVGIEADTRALEAALQRIEQTIAGATDRATDFAAVQSGALDDLVRQTDELSEVQREASQSARDLGLTFASAFEDAVVEGERLSDLLRGLEKDILRILTRRLVTEPLADALTDAVSGGQNLLGDVFGAYLFHEGGRVGSSAVSRRVVPAAAFEGAPRFQAGGVVGLQPRLAPGEIPAILHRGETVRTPAQEAALERRRAGGAGDTRIVVNIETPDAQSFNRSRGQIEALLADAVRRGRRNR